MSHKAMINLEKSYIEKRKVHIPKNPNDISDVDIEDILVSSKYFIGKKCFKYFIGYVNQFDDDVKPLLIKLSKFSGSINFICDLCL